jgi:hypothetical protein
LRGAAVIRIIATVAVPVAVSPIIGLALGVAIITMLVILFSGVFVCLISPGILIVVVVVFILTIFIVVVVAASHVSHQH